MASLFDSKDLSGLGPNPVALYTAATPCVLMSLKANNVYKSTLPVSFWIQRGANVIKIVTGARVKAGDSRELLEGSKVAIEQGDVVFGSTPIAGTFSGVLSIFKDQ